MRIPRRSRFRHGTFATVLIVATACAGGGNAEYVSAGPVIERVSVSQVAIVGEVTAHHRQIGEYGSGVTLTVQDVLWALDEMVLSSSVRYEPPRVRPGDEVAVVTGGVTLPDGPLLMFVGTFLPWDSGVRPWFLSLLVDPHTGEVLADPVTVDALRDEILLGEGDSDRIGALVDFVAESAAVLRAKNLGVDPPSVPRYDRVQASLKQTPRPGGPNLDEWLSIPAAVRPLAVMHEDVIPASDTRLGVEWERFEVRVFYDREAFADGDALALIFPSVGRLGLFDVNRETVYSDPTGQAEGVGSIALFGWVPGGRPFHLQLVGTAGETVTLIESVERSDASYLVIDLRDHTVRSLSEDEYWSLVESMRP